MKLFISILICEGTGIISGLLSKIDIEYWFSSIKKPNWNPPAYLFGPVWTVLYLLMAISLWLIWKSSIPQHQKVKNVLIFAIQLFLNFCWSILFFNLHSPSLAFIDIILFLITIIITMFSFYKISKLSTYLLIPYLLWVSFATILNYSIWKLNY